jgi:23S rRNA (guanosine2251-2'-O)-methyltransferase
MKPNEPAQRKKGPPNFKKEPAQRRRAGPASEPSEPVCVAGLNAVTALLHRSKMMKTTSSIVELVVLQNEREKSPPQALAALINTCKDLSIPIRSVTRAEELPVHGLNHQRVCLVLRQFPVLEWEDFEQLIRDTDWTTTHGAVGCIVDQVQDPRNFGAILRSAAFFRQRFVIFAKDRQSQLSPLVLKTAAGGASEIALVRVTNLNRALEALKEIGLWIIGTSCDPKASPISQVPLDRPYVVVLGNEEKGVRHELLRNCDYRTFIPGGSGTLDSLNVSVAAGILFHSLSPAAAIPKETGEHEHRIDQDSHHPLDT